MNDSFFIAADHAGFDLKAALSATLAEAGWNAEDLGTYTKERCDYPDYAHALAALVVETQGRGLLICGSGIGMSIAANRHAGVRAALCGSGLEAELARKHNDANVLCLGARFIGVDVAKECVRRFLETEFEGGRHAERIRKLDY